MSDIEAPDPEQIDRQYAAAFIVTESGEVIGSLQAANMSNSNVIDVFGGYVREDDGTAVETVWRELQDVLGIDVDPGDIVPLRSEMSQQAEDDQWEMHHYFYVTIPDEDMERTGLREGQDWARITGQDDPLVPVMYQPVIADIYEKLALDYDE